MRKHKSPIHTFGELFCGPGGMSLAATLGSRDAGVRLKHSWAVDIDSAATSTYKRNFPDAKVLTADIRNVDFRDLSPVRGMAFGFPCNDFSVVGERKGVNGKYGPLYQHCLRAVDTLEPEWFVAENVGGIRSAGAGNLLGSILSQFEELEYWVTPHIYRFEEYGIPQRRHRVVIVGIRKSLHATFRVPRPTGARRSARQALELPPIPPDAPNHEYTRQSPQVIARLQALQPGENAFSPNLPRKHRLNVKGARISQIYRRLDPNEPAYTVTGSGGGGTHVYHWEEPRALTNRERARLQTFPDSFVFEGRKEAVRRQIGMAVPPEGGRVIFRALFQSLYGGDYDWVEPNLAHLLEQTALVEGE